MRNIGYMADGSNARGGLILVVDDEPTVLRSVTTALAMDGYRVMVAENGAAGLDAFTRAPDEIVLVLSDVIMPVLNGLQMAEQIRRIRPEVPILLMTGYSDAVLLTLSKPAPPLIRKPFLPDELLRAIRRHLGRAAGA